MTERRHVLITGATRGIGRAIAEELAPHWHILVGGRRREAVDQVVAQLPSAEPFVAELTDDDATLSAASGIGRLDALVHSAGITVLGNIAELTRSDWRAQFELNVVAVAELTRLLLPRLREANGQVITINSGSGLRSAPGNGSYCASKHALVAFTDALREEERGRVRVTSIHPGRVDTDMQIAIQAQLGHEYEPERYLAPRDVARTVALALSMDPGANLDVVSVRPAR
ncbi:NADP-dependent 3-hydroxy acid dehydrogenase YdfG [Propionibacterium cyclohexanicum]|uniref:NADP-dependent 3-hydroxy acid dehydrogenase YdfG n=1 Tax=Propionibacterium cyclohexanicum TaxID=64702 RepID=A0A1H9SY72_9ACTN|nr:SDR family oxidoreductase [Propionibacterium cyclohexanicum]SER89851.1 NADP-dependent 3-hydroxy acid dehydrogenase YdfG [Propionibacterium cyclohexanicum]